MQKIMIATLNIVTDVLSVNVNGTMASSYTQTHKLNENKRHAAARLQLISETIRTKIIMQMTERSQPKFSNWVPEISYQKFKKARCLRQQPWRPGRTLSSLHSFLVTSTT